MEENSIENQKKKMPILKIVVGVIIGLIAIAIVVMTIALSATNALLVPIEEQLSLLEADQIEQAYQLTSRHFKETVSLEEFEDFVRTNPILTEEKNRSFEKRIIQNDLGLVTGSLVAEADVFFVEYNLINEDGGWKILHISLNPTPPID